MKHKYLFLTALCAGLLAGCNNEITPEKPKTGDEVVFTATNGILADSEKIGISIDKPLNYRNVQCTYTLASHKIAAKNTLYWPYEMDDSKVMFSAYAPYRSEFDKEDRVSFSALQDQSSDENFLASDLRTAVTSSSVKDNYVSFEFTRRMSRLTLYLKSNTDAEIKSVKATLSPAINLNIRTMVGSTSGDKVEMNFHNSGTDAKGVSAWELIAAPQNCNTKVTVETSDGTHSFTVITINLKEGKSYHNTTLCKLGTVQSEVSLTEGEWSSTPDFSYREPVNAGGLDGFTTPGIYKTETEDSVSPLRVYRQGTDQQSIVNKSTSTGYRIMNLPEGEMISICVGSKTFTENKSYSVNVISFGISGLESEYTSNATLIQKDGKNLYFADDNNSYVYLIKTN